jgi:hypothetical protein
LAQSLFLYASLTALVQYELFCGIAHEVEEVRKQRAKKNNKQFYRVAYAGGKQPPEDLNDADALTDWLDERGIIENEWQRIKLIMDSARKLEVDVKKGGGLGYKLAGRL